MDVEEHSDVSSDAVERNDDNESNVSNGLVGNSNSNNTDNDRSEASSPFSSVSQVARFIVQDESSIEVSSPFHVAGLLDSDQFMSDAETSNHSTVASERMQSGFGADTDDDGRANSRGTAEHMDDSNPGEDFASNHAFELEESDNANSLASSDNRGNVYSTVNEHLNDLDSADSLHNSMAAFRAVAFGPEYRESLEGFRLALEGEQRDSATSPSNSDTRSRNNRNGGNASDMDDENSVATSNAEREDVNNESNASRDGNQNGNDDDAEAEQMDDSTESSNDEEEFAENNFMAFENLREIDEAFAERVRGNGSANLEPRTWFVSNPRVRIALRNVMMEARRDEEGVAHYLGRGNVMQNLRRMLFIGQRNNRSGNASGSIGDNSNSNSDGETEETPALAQNGENNENAAPAASNNEPSTPPQEIPISFDRNLPAEHSYMGTNMNRVSGVEYLEAGQTFRILLFMHEHVLFPGEILPFMIHGDLLENRGDEEQNGLLFGICFPSLHGNDQSGHLFGVTCQVYEKGNNRSGQVLFKSRALQRFVTQINCLAGPLQTIANSNARCYGRVKILPEIYLSDPLKTINMGSMNRFRDSSYTQKHFRRLQLASTPIPFHAYDIYNIDHVIEKARNVLATQKLETMPNDPIQQSFWLMRNLHMPDDLIKKAFCTDSVNKRMELIDKSFVQNAHFVCRFCSKKIANCSELFAMSKHGVQTQYCNSAGYIHQTNTVYNLCRNAVNFSGHPSSEFSWFPGYQWQIIVCKRCSHHVGWKFEAEEANLEPKIFYGITSSSVRITTGNQDNSERIPLSRMILSYVATLMEPQ